MEALGGGRLEVVGGCLGTNGYVIVWPHGTEVVEDDPLTIAVPRTGTYALGDDVDLAEQVESVDRWTTARTRSAGCRTPRRAASTASSSPGMGR